MREQVSQRIKDDILAQYKSVREFALANNCDYSRLSKALSEGKATDYFVQLVYTRLGGGFDIYERMFNNVRNHTHTELNIPRRTWYYIRAQGKIPHEYWEVLYNFNSCL